VAPTPGGAGEPVDPMATTPEVEEPEAPLALDPPLGSGAGCE